MSMRRSSTDKSRRAKTQLAVPPEKQTPLLLPIAALPEDEDGAQLLLTRVRRGLMRGDRRLAAVMKAIGKCGYRRRAGGFPTLFQAILRQQLSGKAAATIAQRVHLACGGAITPEIVASLDDATFAAAGVSRQKRQYLRGLAASALQNPTLFAELEAVPDEAAIAALTAIKGIGRWTADMYLIFSLGRLDVLPLDDVSIRAAIAQLYQLRRDAPAAKFEAVAESWRPYRSIACWYLYAHLDRAREGRAGK